jgi:hypothetical protein
MTVADLEIRLGELTSAEKVRVLQTLLFDLTDTWPAIEKTPGVSGGEACIVRTRIPDLKIAARAGLRPSPLFSSTVVRPNA